MSLNTSNMKYHVFEQAPSELFSSQVRTSKSRAYKSFSSTKQKCTWKRQVIGMFGFLSQERMGAVPSFFALLALPFTMQLCTFTATRFFLVCVVYFVPFAKYWMDSTCA